MINMENTLFKKVAEIDAINLQIKSLENQIESLKSKKNNILDYLETLDIK